MYALRRSLPSLMLAITLLLWAAAAPAAEAGVAVARPSWRQVQLTAFTRARAEMPVISEAAGRCLQVPGDVGDAVGPGGVFARLDDVFVRLDQEANQVEQKRLMSRIAYFEKEVGRHAKLVARKSEPQQKLDTLEQDLDQARLQLKALKTQARILAERRERFTVEAPPGWLVVTRQVEPGKWVTAGAVLGRVGDFSTLLVPLALSPAEYHALQKAPRPLILTVPATGAKLKARVERVSPAFDPTTRKINLDLAVSDGLAEMRGGVRVELTLSMPDPAGAVLLPARAVTERYQEHWLRPEKGPEMRVVLLGPGPDGLVRVGAPGLKPGMRFLLAPER